MQFNSTFFIGWLTGVLTCVVGVLMATMIDILIGVFI